MNYELALKLKEAGFPQDATYDVAKQIRDNVKYPTLSELIKACGDKFDCLSRVCFTKENNNYGYCAENQEDSFFTVFCGDGNTPEEAVANLWLAINKKDSDSIVSDSGTKYITVPTPKGWKCKIKVCNTDFIHNHGTFTKLFKQ